MYAAADQAREFICVSHSIKTQCSFATEKQKRKEKKQKEKLGKETTTTKLSGKVETRPTDRPLSLTPPSPPSHNNNNNKLMAENAKNLIF